MPGAELHRLDGVFDRGVRGHEDHERFRRGVLDVAQNGQPVPIRQLVVQQDNVGAEPDPVDRLGGGSSFNDVVALAAKALAERPANQVFVIDDEQRRGSHGSLDGISPRQRENFPGHDPICGAHRGRATTTPGMS